MYTNEFRLQFYIGENLWNNKESLSEDEKKMLVNIATLNTIKHHDRARYGDSLKELLRKTGHENNKMFSVVFGDNIHKQKCITIVKNRWANETDGILLKCLNYNRHWELVYQKPRDAPFENKQNKIIWRGSTTGSPNCSANRFTFVKSWFDKNENIDIGFSKICQNKDEYKLYIKENLAPQKMLMYKYIVSIDGNDKDSGLNWKLNSNSIVFMARPKITSWLMETLLVQNFHYIQLKDDFTDLYEKYIWCENNPEKCKNIIKNANNFMSMFSDIEQEDKLEQQVINKYFEIMNKKQ